MYIWKNVLTSHFTFSFTIFCLVEPYLPEAPGLREPPLRPPFIRGMAPRMRLPPPHGMMMNQPPHPHLHPDQMIPPQPQREVVVTQMPPADDGKLIAILGWSLYLYLQGESLTHLNFWGLFQNQRLGYIFFT